MSQLSAPVTADVVDGVGELTLNRPESINALDAEMVEIMAAALRRWVDQLQQERTGVTPQSKALTPEQQKIQELEARIARLEREKSILKKATALLMSEDLERTR